MKLRKSLTVASHSSAIGGGALADALEANDAMSQGRIDVGINSLAYEPDQFYLTEGLLKVPYLTNDIVAFSKAMSDMNANHEETAAEFTDKNLRMLAAMPTTPLVLNMKDKNITKLSDLKGLSIRGAGETSAIDAALKAVDATPVGMPATEVYTSLQRGVVAGQMTFGFMDGPSWGIEEVTEYWVDPGFGPFAAPFLLMNEETWQGLPEDLQEIVQTATDNLMVNYAENILPKAAEDACEAIKAEDVSLTTLDESVQQEWADLFLDDYLADWKKRINERGVDADEYLAEFEAALEANASGLEVADQGAFLGCSN